MLQKILIINPYGIGDVLFSTPLVSALRENYPGSFIAYICNRRTEVLLKTNPKIDEVFVFEKDEYRALWQNSKIKTIRKFYNFLKELRKRRFDIEIDLSLSRHYSFFMWLLGIRRRIGYNYKNRGKLLNFRLDIEGYETKHIVEYYLDLLKFLDIAPTGKELEFYIDREDKIWARGFLYRNNITKDDIIIGIIPGGGESWGKTAEYKQWSPESFGLLAKRLIESLHAKILILGGQGDITICNRLSNIALTSLNVAGKTTLGQFAALLRECRIVVCNDGGPLHIAVSQGIRTISIFGPVDEKIYGPYPPSENNVVITSNIRCRPCYKHFKLPECNTKKCLEDISVDEVFNAVERILKWQETLE